ncbi:hypothetical protein ACQUZK_10220, partial [Streptococcus pyogenes]
VRRRAAEREAARSDDDGATPGGTGAAGTAGTGGPVTLPLTVGLVLGVAATGVYGGYFGAAQGVVLLALLGIGWTTDLHRA